MSVITDCLVYGHLEITGEMEQVNERLAVIDEVRGQQFREVSFEHAGGVKFFCGEVWAGAFNHLPPSSIVEAIVATPTTRSYRDWDDAIVIMDPYDYDVLVWAKSVKQLREEAA